MLSKLLKPNMVVGKNTIATYGIRFAALLNLPNPQLYTGHTFRRSGASLLADAGASENDIQKFLNHKNPTTSRGYIDRSKKRARERRQT